MIFIYEMVILGVVGQTTEVVAASGWSVSALVSVFGPAAAFIILGLGYAVSRLYGDNQKTHEKYQAILKEKDESKSEATEEAMKILSAIVKSAVHKKNGDGE